MYNKTLPEMFAIALAEGVSQFAPEQIIVDVRNPDLLDRMYVIMHQQLERQYPDYMASIEHRIVAGLKTSVVLVSDRERGILE